jgi:MFS family permease
MIMLAKAFTDKIGTAPKTAFTSAVLVANAFIWGFYSFHFLTLVTEKGGLTSNQILAVRGSNFLGIVIAALMAAFLVYHFGKRVIFLRYWMLAGTFLSIVPAAVDITGFFASILFFSAMGVYFGLGMPVAFAYFAASTESENRSRLGGIIFFAAFFGVIIVSAFGITDIMLNALLLAGCQTVGLVITKVVKPQEKEILKKQRVSYGNIISSKPFLLYFIPWIMFIIINFVSLPLVNEIFPDLFQYIEMSGTVLAGILAAVFGFFADYIGRKRLVVAGFALLGFGYASLGLFQNIAGWCLFAVADGFAWGAFCAVFVMTIWGDLSQGKSSEKYYAIGFLPFLFSFFLQLIAPYISLSVPNLAIFSFASVFLFIAVLPLAYAPETLNLKDREFKNYLQKAVNIRLKVETENREVTEASDL